MTADPEVAARPVLESGIAATAEEVSRFAVSHPPPQAGACVTFHGVVRDHDTGRSIRELEYSAHPTAGPVLRQIAQDVADGHRQISSLRVMHRVGLLQIGDCALFAEVCSPHRAEAFAACAELIEVVKLRLPVWKRQVFTDGTDEWVNSP
jgi:molybdopterin synthase catalytic subunit